MDPNENFSIDQRSKGQYIITAFNKIRKISNTQNETTLQGYLDDFLIWFDSSPSGDDIQLLQNVIIRTLYNTVNHIIE